MGVDERCPNENNTAVYVVGRKSGRELDSQEASIALEILKCLGVSCLDSNKACLRKFIGKARMVDSDRAQVYEDRC